MQYIFGAYMLDVQRNELRHAEGAVRLDRQVFAVLAYLVQHHDRVVRRQELFEQLWQERFVSDAALERCIAVARRAVGDSGRTQQIIQTVYKRGYRFVAPVEQGPGEAEAIDTSMAPATAVPTEAVLPLAPTQPEQLGAPPSEQVTPSDARPAEPGTPEAERRHLTVLVCRLVGLPEERTVPLDPAALLEVILDFHRLCAEVVRRYAGHLAQDHGDC